MAKIQELSNCDAIDISTEGQHSLALTVLSGEGVLSVAGQESCFSAGSVMFVPAGQGVKMLGGLIQSGYAIYLERAMMDWFLVVHPIFAKAFVHSGDHISLVVPVSRIALLQRDCRSLADELAVATNHQRLRLLFSVLMLTILEGQQMVPVKAMCGVNELSDLIELNFRRQRSTRFYARRMGLSPRRLNALCRDWFTGKSFFAVLMDRLLAEAEFRLLGSDEPIKVIALDLGFKSSQNFRMYFVRFRGISPSQFRALHGKVLPER